MPVRSSGLAPAHIVGSLQYGQQFDLSPLGKAEKVLILFGCVEAYPFLSGTYFSKYFWLLLVTL